MSSPPTITLRKCPYCAFIFGSDNQDGFYHVTDGMTWTDGDHSDGFNLPRSRLVKCECSKIYKLEEAQIVGLDSMEDKVENGFIRGRHVEEVFKYLNIPSLKGFKGSTLRHGISNSYDYYLPLPGLPDDYKEPEHYGYGQPSWDEILKNKWYTTPEEELETRIKIWWSQKDTQNFSDNYKMPIGPHFKPKTQGTTEDNNILRGFTLSDEDTINALRLLELWDLAPTYSNNFTYRIMKADLLRQLGHFEDCMVTLDSITAKATLPSDVNLIYFDSTINLIADSCKEKIRCPRKFESGNTDWW